MEQEHSLPSVEYLSKLALIRLTEEQKDTYTEQLSSILAYVQKLDEVISEKELSPVYQDMESVTRSDEVTHLFDCSADDLMDKTKSSDGYVIVKKVL
jgi:aspartyl/glutamyl-tRNA(Asn/Gln) amidotransferase C subunit